VVARDALHHRGLLVVVAELGLEHAVDAPHLLLLAKLQPVADGLLHLLVLAVLSGNEVALFDSALLGVAALALQKQLHPFSAAQPAYGTDVSCHLISSGFRMSDFSRFLSEIRDLTSEIQFLTLVASSAACTHCAESACCP